MKHPLKVTTWAFFAVFFVFVVTPGCASADSLTQVVTFGTIDPGCTFEHANCADDFAFTPSDGHSFGGYRQGGSVSWNFNFNTSAFTSISKITMDVLVVGFFQGFTANIDPAKGQIGDYFASDGVPFAPFLNVTDGRDHGIFDLTTSLAAGPHTFSVVAFSEPPGPNLEGWAGVDIATLTVTGQSAGPVPESATNEMLLVGLGLLALVALAQTGKCPSRSQCAHCE